jgi:6-phosphogluconolactonase
VSEAPPRALVLADTDALAAVAADTILQCARTAVAARGRFLLALSGGSTPQALYRLLAGSAYDGKLPWPATVLLWGDERCVPPDDPASNYGSVKKSGLLGRRFASVERMVGELGAEEAARDYERRLRALDASAVPLPPTIDLVLLGVGEDGHTASLLPGSSALAETRRLAVPTEAYGGVRRVTLTLPVLAVARRVLFLVAGAGKATAVAGMLGDPASRLPSALVLRAARQATVLLDEDAAGGAARTAVLARARDSGEGGGPLGAAGVAPEPGVV